MRSQNGQTYWNTGVYLEIVPFGRIVFTDSFADANGNVVPPTHYGLSPDFPLETLLTVTFDKFNGKTKFTLQQSGLPMNVDSENAKQGWMESLDKFVNTLL